MRKQALSIAVAFLAIAVFPSSGMAQTLDDSQTGFDVAFSPWTSTCSSSTSGGTASLSATDVVVYGAVYPGTGDLTSQITFLPNGGGVSGVSGTFTIDALDGSEVHGSYGGVLMDWADYTAPICSPDEIRFEVSTNYTATITTATGTATDQGEFYIYRNGGFAMARFISWCGNPAYGYSAECAAYSPPLPTTTTQCGKGGWKTFGTRFKNQGDCVSYVATKGKNTPARS